MRVLRFSGFGFQVKVFHGSQHRANTVLLRVRDSTPKCGVSYPNYDLFLKQSDASSTGFSFSLGAEVMGFRA